MEDTGQTLELPWTEAQWRPSVQGQCVPVTSQLEHDLPREMLPLLSPLRLENQVSPCLVEETIVTVLKIYMHTNLL